jgi:DNA modification methylase
VKSEGKKYGLKPKDLIGIPWMVAFALRSAGYYLRQDIIWSKPNPMPESVTDRCTKAHEYIFLMSKSQKYYYDHEAIKTEISDTTIKRLMQDTRWQEGSDRVPGKTNGKMKAVGDLRKGYEHRGSGDKKLGSHSGNYAADGSIIGGGMANKKSVWTVTTKPFSEAHFATFPEDLIVDCIKAGCPEGGLILDPFMGAGTTALVARKLNRNYIGFELNPDYIKIANKRLNDELGMFY